MLSRAYYSDQDIRKRQIDTLKIFNDHVTELKPEAEYRVDFAADGKNMSLNVILSPEFPETRPSIFVTPVIPHPWLAENSNEVVNAPGLLNYTPHSDLGRIVQAIIREFQKWLPNLVTDEKCMESPQSHVSAESLMFPVLNDLTIEELQEIMENTDLQDKLVENNPLLVDLEIQVEEVMGSIERIAQDNLAKQQTLDDLKSEVIDRISTIVHLKINYEELNRKHQRLSESYEPHRIKECVREAALKADEEAENIAEQFLHGKIPVEVFVSKFAEKRALGQARRAREERLAHQLAQLDKATT